MPQQGVSDLVVKKANGKTIIVCYAPAEKKQFLETMYVNIKSAG